MSLDLSLSFPFADPRLQKLDLNRLVRLKTVPVTNQSDATFMLDVDQRRTVVVKRNLVPSDVQGEAFGFLVSKELRIRTPQAFVVEHEPFPWSNDSEDDGSGRQPSPNEHLRQGWASSAIENALNWDPIDADLCNQRDLCGIFLLDALLGNPDRHNENVLVVDASNEEPRHVYSIDLALAWCCDAEGFSKRTDDVPTDCQFLRGVNRAAIEVHAPAFFDAAAKLANDHGLVESLVYEVGRVTGNISGEESVVLASTLRSRLHRAPFLLETFLDTTLGR